MCHPEVPAGQATPPVVRQEVQIPLAAGGAMPALLARPEGGEGPAVLIVHDIFGRSPFYENLAARLATAGFVALLPDFFFHEGPLPQRTLDLAFARRSKLDEPRALGDLSTAVDWLSAQPGVSGDRTGSVGFCMGGTLALNLAAQRNDLATVCYYGFVAPEPHAAAARAPAPIDQLEGLRGPILGFWGDQDHGIAMADVERYVEGARQRGVSFEHTIYSGLGHGFMAQSGLDPAHPTYKMACESWARALDFFRQHLGIPIPAEP